MAIDLTAQFAILLERLHGRIVNDLLAVPEDKRTVCPGGVASSPLHMIVECGLLHTRAAAALRSEPLLPPLQGADRGKFFNSIPETEAALAYLQAGYESLLAAIRATDPTEWDAPAVMFPGRSMTRFDVASLICGHLSYHDGQLTYIQMLGGDGASHW